MQGLYLLIYLFTFNFFLMCSMISEKKQKGNLGSWEGKDGVWT